MTPPPVDEYQLQEGDNTEIQRTAEHTKKYADACRQVGAELDIVVVDLWSIFMAEVGWKDGQPLVGSKSVERSKKMAELLSDGKFLVSRHISKLISHSTGLHFNPDGYKLFFDATIEAIKRKWPDQDEAMLPFISPTWQAALLS